MYSARCGSALRQQRLGIIQMRFSEGSYSLLVLGTTSNLTIGFPEPECRRQAADLLFTLRSKLWAHAEVSRYHVLYKGFFFSIGLAKERRGPNDFTGVKIEKASPRRSEAGRRRLRRAAVKAACRGRLSGCWAHRASYAAPPHDYASQRSPCELTLSYCAHGPGASR